METDYRYREQGLWTIRRTDSFPPRELCNQKSLLNRRLSSKAKVGIGHPSISFCGHCFVLRRDVSVLPVLLVSIGVNCRYTSYST